MITAVYCYFAGDGAYWVAQTLTILLDLAIISRVYGWMD